MTGMLAGPDVFVMLSVLLFCMLVQGNIFRYGSTSPIQMCVDFFQRALGLLIQILCTMACAFILNIGCWFLESFVIFLSACLIGCKKVVYIA